MIQTLYRIDMFGLIPDDSMNYSVVNTREGIYVY